MSNAHNLNHFTGKKRFQRPARKKKSKAPRKPHRNKYAN